MAEKGNGKTTDTFVSDLMNVSSSDNADNAYNVKIDKNIFPFGKGITTKGGEMCLFYIVCFHSAKYLWSIQNIR